MVDRNSSRTCACCAEQVSIILSKSTDAGHAGEFAGLLVAVDGAELGEADGEVSVAAGLGGVNLDVVRAVHGLEEVFLVDAVLHDVADAAGGVEGEVGAGLDASLGEKDFLGGVVEVAFFEGGDEGHGGVGKEP